MQKIQPSIYYSVDQKATIKKLATQSIEGACSLAFVLLLERNWICVKYQCRIHPFSRDWDVFSTYYVYLKKNILVEVKNVLYQGQQSLSVFSCCHNSKMKCSVQNSQPCSSMRKLRLHWTNYWAWLQLCTNTWCLLFLVSIQVLSKWIESVHICLVQFYVKLAEPLA